MGLEEPERKGGQTAFAVLVALSVSHLLNDTVQSLIAAVYPVLKDSYALTFTQIGLITLAFQLTASLLQPLVGLYTDRRPLPFSLAIGMGACRWRLTFVHVGFQEYVGGGCGLGPVVVLNRAGGHWLAVHQGHPHPQPAAR